jgi:hypothetical protein
MAFFDNIYRIYGGDEMDPEVEFGEDPPQPRMIPPRMMSYARPGFDTYLEHIKNMPQESDFEASTGRKIAAALVGMASGLSNPAAGYAAAEQIMRSPYTRALSDWQTKGKELSSLAEEEGRFIGNLSDENIAAGTLGVRQGELEAKVAQINNNYDIALRKAKTADERNEIIRQRNADLKVLETEANRIKGIQASAAATRAGAYKKWVDEQPSPGEGRVIPPKIGDMQEAEQDVLQEMLQESPELMQRFFQFNSETGYIDPIINDEDMTEEDLATLQSIKAMIGARAQRRLGGNALGGAPPFRPRVIAPPNRRRNP